MIIRLKQRYHLFVIIDSTQPMHYLTSHWIAGSLLILCGISLIVVEAANMSTRHGDFYILLCSGTLCIIIASVVFYATIRKCLRSLEVCLLLEILLFFSLIASAIMEYMKLNDPGFRRTAVIKWQQGFIYLTIIQTICHMVLIVLEWRLHNRTRIRIPNNEEIPSSLRGPSDSASPPSYSWVITHTSNDNPTSCKAEVISPNNYESESPPPPYIAS